MQLKSLVLAAGAIAFLALNAVAKTPISKDIVVVGDSTWVRWLPNDLPAAGYITLKNNSDEPLDVTKVKSTDYEKVTMYNTVVDGGTHKTVEVDRITIPSHGEFSFAPGAHRLVFEKSTHTIKPGDKALATFFLSDGKVFRTKMPVSKSPPLD